MSEISIMNFLLITFLVLLNGFFVASEFAFVKVRPTQMDMLVASGSRRARRVKQIIDDLDKSLSSTQLGITLASIGLGIVGEEFFKAIFLLIFESVGNVFGRDVKTVEPFLERTAFFLGYLMITFLHVTIGELAPKSISIQFAERTSMVLAEPLYWFMVMTDPLLRFFVRSSNFLLRLVKVPPAKDTHHQVYTEDELKVIIKDSIDKGELEQYESKLIFNILNFTDRMVKAILTPRIDVKALPVTTTPGEILKLSKDEGYSRIPIYANNLDNILGFVHIKDLIGFVMDNDHVSFDIKSVIRPVITVAERKPLDDLLKEMQLENTQVAVVFNEYGSFDGIVTIEDILEYIVGPIHDEFDDVRSRFHIDFLDNELHVDGLITIEALNKTLNEKFECKIQPHNATTLAGYILELSEGELPVEGMKIVGDLFEFEITKTSGTRIERVVLSKLNNDSD